MDIRTRKIKERYEKGFKLYSVWNKLYITEFGSSTYPYDLIMDETRMTSNDRVLSGCSGYGGGELYMASKTGSTITGFDIATTNIELAEMNLQTQVSLDTAINVNFMEGDLNEIGIIYADQKFDVFYSVDGYCHLIDKIAFFGDLNNILNIHGRIAVMDTFVDIDSLTPRLQDKYEQLMKYWTVPNHLSLSQAKDAMKQTGFTSIKFLDLTEEIRSGVKTRRRLSFLCPLLKFLHHSSRLMRMHSFSAFMDLTYQTLKPGQYLKGLYENENFRYGLLSGELT